MKECNGSGRVTGFEEWSRRRAEIKAGIQHSRHVALFQLFTEYRDIIERVSFWNFHDGQSWLNCFPWRRVNHPLLFDRERRPKPCFDAVYDFLKRGNSAAK